MKQRKRRWTAQDIEPSPVLINRLKQKKLETGTPIYTDYTYKASGLGGKYTTTQIETEKLDKVTYKYYYDKVGNITGIDKGSAVYRTYTYDKKNQLLSEVNSTNGITTNFTYDAIGNITKKVQSGAVSKTINYRYGNDGKTGWNNLLTAVNLDGDLKSDGTPDYETDETIDYDEIGNPTKYLGASLAWNGRELTNYKKDTTDIKYTYDADGLRGSKIVTENKVDTKHTYHYVSGQLRYEERGNLKFYYFYDASGNLSAIRYCDESGVAHAYFALTNAQGDVVAFYTGAGRCVVTYEYDAWGNVISVKDGSGNDISTDEDHIANLNPIRYRGYYYDTETGLYYLQSRYYNPQVGRFLNADGTLNGNGDVLGFNMFAYCGNNPVMGYDPNGWFDWGLVTDIAVTAFSAISAIGVGLCAGTITFCLTGNPALAVLSGGIAATTTFGAINNTVNATYYNFISDGKSAIQEDDSETSDYVSNYINRWERLDYTKQVTQETYYNINAWRFHSEYTFHMYGWYAFGWSNGKGVPIISGYAQSCQKADVSIYEWDSRPYVNAGTIIVGFLGL